MFIIGGGGGFGKVLVFYFIFKGKKVIFVGRIKFNFEFIVKEIGVIDYYVFDMGKILVFLEFVFFVM